MAKGKKIVVRVSPSVQQGRRRRAGFVFDHKPSSVVVTKEQEELIKNDEFLLIVTKGLALEDGMKNANTSDKTASEDDAGDEVVNTDDSNNGDDAGNDQGGPAATPAPEAVNLDDDKADKKKAPLSFDELMQKSPKKLVKMLVGKGKVDGTDFDSKAAKESLVKLLLTLE